MYHQLLSNFETRGSVSNPKKGDRVVLNTGTRRLPLQHRKREIADRVTLAGIDCDEQQAIKAHTKAWRFDVFIQCSRCTPRTHSFPCLEVCHCTLIQRHGLLECICHSFVEWQPNNTEKAGLQLSKLGTMKRRFSYAHNGVMYCHAGLFALNTVKAQSQSIT